MPAPRIAGHFLNSPHEWPTAAPFIRPHEPGAWDGIFGGRFASVSSARLKVAGHRGVFGSVWACLAVLGGLATGPSAPLAAEPIRSVEITGTRRLDPATVRLHTSLREGDTCDAARLNSALRAAFATGLYADVRIDCHSGKLHIAVVENPVIARVEFKGRSAIEEKELSRAARISAKQVHTRASADAAAERVRELYRSKGYAEATVKVETATDPRDQVTLTFVITEAQIVKVTHVAFTGNRAFSDGQLRDVITTRQAGFFDFLRAPAPPVADRLAFDRSLLVAHYRKHGFTDVEIGEPRAERRPGDGDDAARGWLVTFSIDEGQRYAVGPITVSSSLPGIPTDKMRHLIAMKSGNTYDPGDLDASLERMTMALVETGNVSAEVRALPKRDPVARTMGIAFEIVQGPRIIVDRIEIAGNGHTRDEVIRRELNIAEGDVYNTLVVELARKRLMRLGLFRSVEIGKRPTSEKAKDRVVLTVSVVEIDTREIGFGIGYSQNDGIIGDITLAERNLLGRGQDLRVKLATSEKSSEARLSFTEPRFLGTRVAAGFDLFYKDTDLTSTSSYKSNRYGGSLRVGTQVAPDTTSTVSYNLSRSTMYDVGDGASSAVKLAVPGYPAANAASYVTSSVGHVMTYDTRNSRTIPTKGIMVTSGQELAGLGGDVRFLRTTAEARAYIPVTDEISLATKASGGVIGGWGGSDVRLLDTFYRGGDIVRGFATSGIGPRDVLSTAKDALGGTTYLASTAELRIAIPGVTESTGLRAALFADAGTLFGTSNAAKALPGVVGTTASLRASVGAGLTWDSPVGPLQAGYAFPVAKQPFDKVQNAYFGLGSGL